MNKIEEMEARLSDLTEAAFDMGRAAEEKDSPFKSTILDQAWKLGRKHRVKQPAQ
jgi:hypothetical protein